MDPNETLRLIRRELDALRSADQWDDLAELVSGLDEWLSRGGFPPEAWREGPDAFGEESPVADDGTIERAWAEINRVSAEYEGKCSSCKADLSDGGWHEKWCRYFRP